MVKRSELKKDMYVRMSDVLDNESYWSRLMKGRYFQVDKPATEPDDSSYWSMTLGTIIMYGMNYCKQASNDNMELVNEHEQKRLKYILKHKEEFKDLFKTGKKIERLLDNIEETLDEIGVYRFDLWDVPDTEIFIDRVLEEIPEDFEVEDYEIEDLKEMFTEVESLLDELTLLENKYIRGNENN